MSIFLGTVQYNCAISDARHAADYGMCTYLLKMREYYRWEKNFPFAASLSQDEIGDWLEAREQLWESLEGADFSDVVIADKSFSPFDSLYINQQLQPYNLAYSSGYGRNSAPLFFLGEKVSCDQADGIEILVIKKELTTVT